MNLLAAPQRVLVRHRVLLALVAVVVVVVGLTAPAAYPGVDARNGVATINPEAAFDALPLKVSPATGGGLTGSTVVVQSSAAFYVYDAPAVSRVDADGPLVAHGSSPQVATGGDGSVPLAAGVEGASMTPGVLTYTPRGARPDLPDGYHYRTTTSGTHVVRNPGRAGDLPPLRLEGGQLRPGSATGFPRSSAERSSFLKKMGDDPTTPSHLRPWLKEGRTPPGYAVDHMRALFDGGADVASNMRLRLVADHITRHRYYRPGGQVPTIGGGP